MKKLNIWSNIQNFCKKIIIITGLIALVGIILIITVILDKQWGWIFVTPFLINFSIIKSSDIVDFLISILTGTLIALLVLLIIIPKSLVWFGALLGIEVYFLLKEKFFKRNNESTQ